MDETDMWLKLTKPNGRTLLVDFDKVIMIEQLKNGTKVCYPVLAADSSGAQNFKGATVKEDVGTIEKMLKKNN